MLTWNDISRIYDAYQEQKGIFRKFFRTDSIFMRFIAILLRCKSPKNPISSTDKVQLLKKIIEIPKSDQKKLSRQLANSIIVGCTEDNTFSIFKLFESLHRVRLFSESLFVSITTHSDAVFIANEFLSLKSYFASQARQPFTLLSTHEITTECCLAYIFMNIGNKEKALSWFQTAVGKNQTISIADFPNTKLSAQMLFFIAKHYEDGIIVPKDIPRAVLIYEKAAELNSVCALHRLGELYQMDCPAMQQDKEKAFQRYLQAAHLGSPQAKIVLKRFAHANNNETRRQISQPQHYLWAKEKQSLEIKDPDITPRFEPQ